MNGSGARFYLRVGSLFGIILAAPVWYDSLLIEPWPSDSSEYKALALNLTVAAVQGVLRALAWLPSLIYHCGIHRMPLDVWLFEGWW